MKEVLVKFGFRNFSSIVQFVELVDTDSELLVRFDVIVSVELPNNDSERK